MIAKGVILKNSEGALQLWRDEKSPCFRLCHRSQVSLQLWKETVLHALIDCWYKAKGSENCKPPSAKCHASDQNKIKAGPFPVVNLLISLQAPDLHFTEIYIWASVQTAPSHPCTLILSGYSRLCEQFTYTHKHSNAITS